MMIGSHNRKDMLKNHQSLRLRSDRWERGSQEVRVTIGVGFLGSSSPSRVVWKRSLPSPATMEAWRQGCGKGSNSRPQMETLPCRWERGSLEAEVRLEVGFLKIGMWLRARRRRQMTTVGSSRNLMTTRMMPTAMPATGMAEERGISMPEQSFSSTTWPSSYSFR